MTCLEAQSHIMSFVDGSLPESQLDDFVMHMQHCPNCFEELEIYYTLIVGMNKLDNYMELPKDFRLEIIKKFKRIENKRKNSFKFKLSAFSLIISALLVVFVLFYDAVLGYVYNYEQQRKINLRGELYFYSTFKDNLFRCDKDIIYNYQQQMIKQEDNIYIKIKDYNLINDEIKR